MAADTGAPFVDAIGGEHALATLAPAQVLYLEAMVRWVDPSEKNMLKDDVFRCAKWTHTTAMAFTEKMYQAFLTDTVLGDVDPRLRFTDARARKRCHAVAPSLLADTQRFCPTLADRERWCAALGLNEADRSPRPINRVHGDVDLDFFRRLERNNFNEVITGLADVDGLQMLAHGTDLTMLPVLVALAEVRPLVVAIETSCGAAGVAMVVHDVAYNPKGDGHLCVSVEYLILRRGDMHGDAPHATAAMDRVVCGLSRNIERRFVKNRSHTQDTLVALVDDLRRNATTLRLEYQARHLSVQGWWLTEQSDSEEARMDARSITAPFRLSYLEFPWKAAGMLGKYRIKELLPYFTSVDAARAKGNELYKLKSYHEAINTYMTALQIDVMRANHAPLYANVAQCFLLIKEYDTCISTATTGLHYSPSAALKQKLLWRRGCAYAELGRCEEALRDIEGADLRTAEAARKIKALKERVGQHTRAEVPMSDTMDAVGRQWATGLSAAEAREWWVDCYRMRVDDEMVYQGEPRGLYAASAMMGGMDEVVHDFLIFAKLSVMRGALPVGWDWRAAVGKGSPAAELLKYAFEKADAQEKYGSENVFAVVMGGRSLRATGEFIMGSSVVHPGDEEGVQDEYDLLDDMDGYITVEGVLDEMTGEVGGPDVWYELLYALCPPEDEEPYEPPPKPQKDKARKDKAPAKPKAKAKAKPGKPKQPCRYWPSGACRRGTACPFSHGGAASKAKTW